MTKKFIVTVTRTQECKVCVEVPDNATRFGMLHQEDANELLSGVIGLDWETVEDYEIEDVTQWTEESEWEASADIELAHPIHLQPIPKQ